MDHLELKPAKESHLKEIFEIASSYRLKQNIKKDITHGFLVSDFTLEDYKYLLNKSNYFFVLAEGEKTIGFLLAYSSDRIGPEEELNTYIKGQYSFDFVIIKQICIRKGFSGKGYGKLLYNHLFQQSEIKTFFAAVVVDPINDSSISFHESQGFTRQFTYLPKDNIPRGVWRKIILNKKDTGFQQEVLNLSSQYRIFVNLYQHEDNLNWTKFQHLIYFNSGFIAILGFLLGRTPKSQFLPPQIIFLTFCIIGLLTTIAMGTSISFGTRYLMDRKNKSVALEKRLIEVGAEPLLRQVKYNHKFISRSPTVIILTLLPILIALSWIFIMIFGLIHFNGN